MPHPVVHVEIRSQDPDATRRFLGELFGSTVPGIFWPMRARLPIVALFAGKKVAVRAHRVFRTRPTGASNLTATTDVSWVLTLTPEN